MKLDFCSSFRENIVFQGKYIRQRVLCNSGKIVIIDYFTKITRGYKKCGLPEHKCPNLCDVLRKINIMKQNASKINNSVGAAFVSNNIIQKLRLSNTLLENSWLLPKRYAI